jgi:ABC-2 type transport system ATP-binding protein
LGLAAAILGKPKYLMLDEPANGLDPEGIAWLREFLKSYADQGNAVFVSSHGLSEMAQMADNVVVIGRGKLIADTSMEELIAKNGRSGVFVRSPKLSVLERALKGREAVITKADGGVTVSGLTTDEIGKIAFESGVPVYELAEQTASLEAAFLELTADSQEFAAKKETT